MPPPPRALHRSRDKRRPLPGSPQRSRAPAQDRKKILQRKVVKDNNAWMLARRVKDPRVIAVIVADVVDRRVVVVEGLQNGRMTTVITVSKLSAYLRVRRFEAVNK